MPKISGYDKEEPNLLDVFKRIVAKIKAEFKKDKEKVLAGYNSQGEPVYLTKDEADLAKKPPKEHGEKEKKDYKEKKDKDDDVKKKSSGGKASPPLTKEEWEKLTRHWEKTVSKDLNYRDDKELSKKIDEGKEQAGKLIRERQEEALGKREQQRKSDTELSKKVNEFSRIPEFKQERKLKDKADAQKEKSGKKEKTPAGDKATKGKETADSSKASGISSSGAKKSSETSEDGGLEGSGAFSKQKTPSYASGKASPQRGSPTRVPTDNLNIQRESEEGEISLQKKIKKKAKKKFKGASSKDLNRLISKARNISNQRSKKGKKF